MLWWLIVTAIFIFPVWKSLGKAGMNPAISLLSLIPIIGWALTLRIFAKGKWPTVGSDGLHHVASGIEGS